MSGVGLWGDLDVHAPGGRLLVRLREWFLQAETELLRETKHCPPLTPQFREFLGRRILRFLDVTRQTFAVEGVG